MYLKLKQAFETKSLWKLLCISYLEHKTNTWVQSKVNFSVGPQDPLLATAKGQKLGLGMSNAMVGRGNAG